MRRHIEDGLSWFDREREERKDEHSEEIHRRAIETRIEAEEQRKRLGSYRRVGQRR